ncbi:MAG: restriction endonuclease [Clostridia bacterium]|nr:restriction endonuclease [Clostridia bacterium]
MDMSFLFGEVKPKKEEQKRLPEKEEPKRLPEKSEVASKAETPKEEPKKQMVKTKLTPPTAKTESAPQPLPQKEGKPAPVQKTQKTAVRTAFNATRSKPKTADEKLQEAFLSRLRRLGGDYFEYYSVYLLEKYSRRNGRRLESMKISGGDHDGGIDGEIELTDRLGFRETIYIQAKNWDPDKGDERLWTVGETLLQQFIGACVCRQAKDGKQHCRGIFITTSRFTPEAKRILEETSDKFVGYDGTDLFETAKECEFGIIRKNGEWALDENLLSGERALFHIL